VTTLPQLVFLHGLESGPHGSKYRLLASLDLGSVIAPDCEGVHDPRERLRMIETTLGGHDDLVLVGSSFGGLMALLYAAAHPAQVAGLVLCAPAVHRPELIELPDVAKQLPVRVIHGRQDDVVPLAAVRAYCEAHGLSLTVVDDGHRLANSHAAIERLVRAVVGVYQRGASSRDPGRT
jgi:pimeloyl-ACP methyl ester carboxylesterase